MKTKKWTYIWWMMGVVVLAGAFVTVMLNRQWIVDFWRGMSYETVGEMGAIRDKLNLTDGGEFLFKAAWPRLSGQDEFNAKCRTEGDAEIAVLGCYVGGDIYVYDIKSAELDGIRELTTAHELLHAVWARMGEDERRELGSILNRAYEANRDILESELATYDAGERQEELFVRAGTEVKNLPAELEKIYAEIFVNQDAVVDFYEGYIGVFQEIETEMDGLMAEMEGIQAEIDAKTADYEVRAKQLNADIVSFNVCAEVVGCFKSDEEFYERRARILAEQDALAGLYDEINWLVDEYNVRVTRYNEDVTRTEKLNSAMNSNARVEGV